MANIPEDIPAKVKMVYEFNTYFMKDEEWHQWFLETYLKENKGYTFHDFKKQVHSLLEIKETQGEMTVKNLDELLEDNPDFLKIILIVLGISDEFFKRVITFLRNEGEGSDWMEGPCSSEWSINTIKSKIKNEPDFRKDICELFINGCENELLKKFLPDWHLSRFSKKHLFFERDAIIDKICKTHISGTRNAKKGDIPELKIERELKDEGIPYYRGEKKLGLFDKDDPKDEPQWDFFIPNEDNPIIIVEVTYEQTTASGMNRKVRDISSAYRELKSSCKYSNISVVAFIDGVGWLARGESAICSIGNSVDKIFTTHPDEINRFIVFVKDELRKQGISLQKQMKIDE